MSKITELAAGRLADSADLLIILAEPDGIAASVVIHWPGRPTTIDPARFREAAAAIVRLFSDANSTLTRIKGGGCDR